MEIGKKLKGARHACGLTQENVAEKLNVSRQTISNWENEKFYPDILYILQLSDLYQVSLDELLKGDKNMIQHLEDSTNIVKSNRKILLAFLCNICLLSLSLQFPKVIS
ncbi:putative transcriptional regulator [Streptococcus macacae NCTC 11558]|uniref:Bacteriophage CI repressor protein n=1 Tax=Streptococcus macacae NCTC 11558 TaxID=764298 RepID=G5JVU7_9STRE|nr:bacteriophage CI repressor protein [Streptococcus macacae NCTC 11558]SUN78937.1 putative transcriptional regulator [Streptococcus macacae NCTC 11558]